MQPNNNNGSIQIRFTKFGYRYSLNKLGKFDDDLAWSKACQICKAILGDMNIGRFTAKDNDELFAAYHPLANIADHHTANTNNVDCIDLVLNALSSKALKDRNLSNTYNFLKRYGKPIKSTDDAMKFWTWLQLTSKGNNRTINRHLESLKPICLHFRDIPKLKTSQSKDEKPFSKDEIKAIIQAIDQSYAHYSAFVKFLFSTGCRPNEATALTWDCIDFTAKTITIRNAVSIAQNGSKTIKGTKTGIVRIIPMSEKVYELLNTVLTDMGYSFYDELVFASPKGQFIDIRNFRARVWTKALEAANVPYRTLYNTRHTFCSHFLNETPDFVKLCSITHGSKSGIATLQKHYAHIVDKPVMPDMF